MTNGRVYITLIATWLLLCGFASAQNRILVVTDSMSDILPRDSVLVGMLNRTYHQYDYTSYLPDPLSVYEYSAVILASRSAAVSCHLENLDRYIRSGGALICAAGIPYYLVPDSVFNPVTDWFGCAVYANASGSMRSTASCSLFGVADEQLLDSTACGIGFGGFNGPSADVSVLARWKCGQWEVAVSTLTRRCGDGKVFYMSRVTSSEKLKDIFVAGIGYVQKYFWGDANGSREVDVDDVLFLIDYIFGAGRSPEIRNAADPSGDGQIDIDDVVRLIGWVFEGQKDLRAGRIE